MFEKTLSLLERMGNTEDVAEAVREVNVAIAGIKYYQIVLKRMDRDEKIVQEAIEEATWMRNNDLVRRLKMIMEPVKVPYEELVKKG